MSASDVIITREIASIPLRDDAAHKGQVGRIAIIGGCCDERMMAGAPALAANAAFRSGAGLVQIFVPEMVRTAVASLAPCSTILTMPTDADSLLAAVKDFDTDVVVLGPGLGKSLSAEVVGDFLAQWSGPIVVDADGLNRLAEAPPAELAYADRVILTPHPGEAGRLLGGRGDDRAIGSVPSERQSAACALRDAYGGVIVLKGRGTVVTDGKRLFVNETGNAGMATGGAGDVLTGVIAALVGQRMEPIEAAILGVYLHGLTGDFASEELGRCSVTAMDLVEYLPEAFSEHEMSESA